MRFTKLAKSLPLWLLVIAAAGCQFVPASKEQPAPGADEDAQSSTVNPYGRDRDPVPSTAATRFERARAAMLAGDYAAAENDLTWLVEAHPKLSGPYLNMALLYVQTERVAEAEPWFQRAIAANERNLNAYNQYAIYLRQQGRFDDAETQYQRALTVWPAHPESHLNLGILYDLYRGEWDKALTHYQRYQALQTEPDRRVAGWIIDLERRLAQEVAQ